MMGKNEVRLLCLAPSTNQQPMLSAPLAYQEGEAGGDCARRQPSFLRRSCQQCHTLSDLPAPHTYVLAADILADF